MTILALDPGTTETAAVLWRDGRIVDAQIRPNTDLLNMLPLCACDVAAIEMVACYGMAVGKEVFETCVWIGRFYERCLTTPRLIFRRDVKMHHCQSARAKDANIRQALIDKYGPPGTKKSPGATYGLKSHLWQAFAIAAYIHEVDAAEQFRVVQHQAA